MFDLNKIVIKSIRKTNDVSMASSPTLNPNIFTPINVLESKKTNTKNTYTK